MVELGIGAAVVLAIAAISVDLYALTKAYASAAQIAVSITDHITRDTTPDGGEISALALHLYERELDAPADLVFVVSAVQQPAGGSPATLLWDDDTLRFGDPGTTTRLAQTCRDRGNAGWREILLGQSGAAPTVTLPDDTVAIVVEVCAELTRQGSLTGKFVGEDIYRLHVAPVRDKSQKPPVRPIFSSVGDDVGPWASPEGVSVAGLTRSRPAPGAAPPGVA